MSLPYVNADAVTKCKELVRSGISISDALEQTGLTSEAFSGRLTESETRCIKNLAAQTAIKARRKATQDAEFAAFTKRENERRDRDRLATKMVFVSRLGGGK